MKPRNLFVFVFGIFIIISVIAVNNAAPNKKPENLTKGQTNHKSGANKENEIKKESHAAGGKKEGDLKELTAKHNQTEAKQGHKDTSGSKVVAGGNSKSKSALQSKQKQNSPSVHKDDVKKPNQKSKSPAKTSSTGKELEKTKSQSAQKKGAQLSKTQKKDSKDTPGKVEKSARKLHFKFNKHLPDDDSSTPDPNEGVTVDVEEMISIAEIELEEKSKTTFKFTATTPPVNKEEREQEIKEVKLLTLGSIAIMQNVGKAKKYAPTPVGEKVEAEIDEFLVALDGADTTDLDTILAKPENQPFVFKAT